MVFKLIFKGIIYYLRKMEKRKRGRKPKNNIVVNENPNFNTNKKLDNLIICLKNKKTYQNENKTYIIDDFKLPDNID